MAIFMLGRKKRWKCWLDLKPSIRNPERIPKPRKSNPKIKYSNPKNETRKKKKSMSQVWFNELSLARFFWVCVFVWFNEPSWLGWLILLLIVWNKLGFVEFFGFWVFKCLRFLGFLWFYDFGYESLGKNKKNWWIFSIGLCSLLKFYCIIDLILSGKGSWFNGFNFEFVF